MPSATTAAPSQRYLAGVLAFFIFLRAVGYPVSIIHVAWPPSWHRVGQARGWFFMEKARQSFAANRTSEAILYLSNAYEFDPANYAAGLTLAKTLQVGQPIVSNRIFDRLLHEHPARHDATAQEWFRALLARGDFEAISTVARDEVLAGGPHASVWMRALVFAARQGHRDSALRTLRESPKPAAIVWQPLLDTELLSLAGHSAQSRALLDHADWTRLPPYGVFYQVSRLTELGDAFAALDALDRNGSALDTETRVSLELAAYARQGSQRPLHQLVTRLLASKLNLPVLKVLAAHLIRYPDQAVLDQVYTRFRAEPLPFTTDSAGVYFSLLCAAAVNADWPKFDALRTSITEHAGSSQAVLAAVEAFFRGRTGATRITSYLPALPLPIEVNYALIERYPGATAPAVSPSKPGAAAPALSLSKGPAVTSSKGRP